MQSLQEFEKFESPDVLTSWVCEAMTAWLLGYYLLLEHGTMSLSYYGVRGLLESCFGERRDGLSLFVVNSSLN